MTLVRMPRAWKTGPQAGKAVGTPYLSIFPIYMQRVKPVSPHVASP